MSDETKVCACKDCTCPVKESETYCSDACANGHPDGRGCGHPGCNCGG